ncbi:MAG TPA: TonB-dependent receptor [Steroidobacteraceae bacterium]|jgi:outer membrane receptor protein involved in Fe transport|nr:TonB-dependent receptor [Steroidobacteraceae bacterium]
MFIRAMAAAGAAAIFAGAGGSAIAAPAASASDTAGLEEIVVTAQRREESAQNVGIAMSVISGQSLADKSISRVNDLQNAVPSLQVEPAFGSSQPQFRLRGIGFIDYTSNNTSPVGVSLDGVAFALPIQTQGQLFDIDRVEVLRGPQGTLYGRNTTGGEINFISNRPTAEPHAGISLEYGTHNEVRADGFASGSIAEGLTGRLSVATEQGGAWQRNRVTGQSLGDEDKIAVRGQLQWRPADAVDVRLGVHGSQDKSDEQGLYLLAPFTPGNGAPTIPPPPTIPADTSRYATGWSLNPAFAKLIGINANSKPGLNNSNDGADLTANIDLGGVKLTGISAYNKLIRREYADWDATQFNASDEYLNSDFNVFSQELRLAAGSGRFDWVAGLFYSDEDLHEDFYSDLTNRLGGITVTTYEQAAHSVGVFAQGNYRLTDTLKATLGLREDHENRELIGLNTAFLPGAPSLTGGALDRSITSNLPSGKLELDYQPLSATLFYASISRGVKSGGFTAHNTVTAPSADPFEPEKLTAYEIGVKSDLTPTLRANGSVFYYRYKDQQILGKVFDDASQTFIGSFVNADSRINGGEIDLEWRPLAGISISQYAGFVQGYYTSRLLNVPLDPTQPSVDYNGRPESIPKWSYGGDASYSWNVGAFTVTAESNYSFHDTYSQFFLLGSNDFTIPKYWLANANLSLAPASGGPWTLGLWGRNIFDKSYDLTRNFFLPGSEVAAAGEPATVGIRLSYKY